MKDFLRYSKNRILYNIFRFLIIALLAFFVSKCNVYASESQVSITGAVDFKLFWGVTGCNTNTSDGCNSIPEAQSSGDFLLNQSITIPGFQHVSISGGGSSYTNFYFGVRDFRSYFNINMNSGNKYRIVYKIYAPSLSTDDSVSRLNSCQVDLKGNTCSVLSSSIKKEGDYIELSSTFIVTVSGSSLYFQYGNYTVNDLASQWHAIANPTSVGQSLKVTSVSVYKDNEQQEIINSINAGNQQTNNKLDEIKDQNTESEKTRKSILQRIIDLPGNIINGLIDGLKSLFIPSNDFFESFINDFLETVKEKLGFLVYPFELIGDVINRFLTIPEASGIIHIPQINEPFSNTKLISDQDFNLKEIFNTGKIGELYNIYLIFVDGLVIVGLVNLARKKYNETIGSGK